MAKWEDKVKNDTVNKINHEVLLVQKDHFKHLNKINRLNLEGFKRMSNHFDDCFKEYSELTHSKINDLNFKQQRNDLKITIMLVIITLLTLTNLLW